MVEPKIRIGVIGLGKIAQTQYLQALVHNDRAELVGLCDISESLAKKVALVSGLPDKLAVFSLNQLIARAPQLVFVLTHDHEEISCHLIDAGISVCIEKPICWSSDRAALLTQRAREKGVRLYACYMKQFDQTFELLINRLRTENHILSVNVQCYAGNNKKWCDPIFLIQKESADEKIYTKAALRKAWDDFYSNDSMERAASQLLLQLGIHQINLLHALLGDYSVEACVRKKQGNNLSISAIFGQVAYPVNYSLTPLFAAPWDWRETYTFVCQDSIMTYEPGCPFLSTSTARLTVTDSKNGLGFTEYRTGYHNPFALMIQAIIDSFDEDGSGDERLSPNQAVRDLRTIENMLDILRGAK